jgi:hypothetical protein
MQKSHQAPPTARHATSDQSRYHLNFTIHDRLNGKCIPRGRTESRSPNPPHTAPPNPSQRRRQKRGRPAPSLRHSERLTRAPGGKASWSTNSRQWRQSQRFVVIVVVVVVVVVVVIIIIIPPRCARLLALRLEPLAGSFRGGKAPEPLGTPQHARILATPLKSVLTQGQDLNPRELMRGFI